MSTAHIYSVFDEELKHLSRRIAEMGGMAEQMVSDAIHALVTSDSALAQRVISEDSIMDATEREIGDKAILMIAKRQPVAADPKRVIAVQTTGIPRPLARGIEHLSELALTQLKDVLDVYSTRSAEKAEQIRARDEEIDAMYTSLFRELLTYMMEDPRNITPCTHLLFCAKNIERIGDHATNIAETIYYMSTGEQPAGERPKDDNTASVVQPGS